MSKVEHYRPQAFRDANLPFSPAVRVGNMLYLSGQIAIPPGGDALVPGGIQAETLRYWEKEGLLAPTSRSASGYRDYSPENLAQVEFIKQAKSVGFTLSEIAELLSIRIDPESHTCADVKKLADTKLTEIERKIAELKQMHKALSRISDICCGGDESATHCTILNALNRPGTND